MLNKKNYGEVKSLVQLCVKRAELLSQFNMVIKNKICSFRERTDFENVRTFVCIETAAQFMIFITFETRHKTCSKGSVRK